MPLHPSIGARPNADGTGTSALDVRKDLSWIFTGPGVLPGAASPLVAGTSGWSYSVGAAGFVTQRAASDGVHLLGNDGPVSVATTAAPGTGSRIDVIWVRQRSNGENGDTTSVPDFGVTEGSASGSPVKPAIPTGALELATSVVAAGSADTAAATITQTAARARLVGANRVFSNTLAAESGTFGASAWSTSLGSANLPAENVRITLSGEVSTSVADSLFSVRVRDGSASGPVLAQVSARPPAVGGPGLVTWTRVARVAVTPGSRTLFLEGSRAAGTGSGTIRPGFTVLIDTDE